MKKILYKIIISLSAFILVLSFSFGHLNTSKRFEVHASEYSITQQVAAVIAVLLAAAGIQIVNEPTLDQMQTIYNGLSVEAQGVLSSPTLGNNIVEGMIALPYAQAQTAIHSLVNTFQAWEWSGTKSSNDYIATDLSNLLTEATIIYSDSNYIKKRSYFNMNGIDFDFQSMSIINSSTEMNTISIPGYSQMLGYRGTYDIKAIPIFALGSLAYPSWTDHADTLFLAQTFSCVRYTTHQYGNPCLTGNGIDYNDLVIGYPGTYSIEDLTVSTAMLGLLMNNTGLTLPAPTNGWDNSEPGDIDLEGWTKGLTIPDVGDVVVLGGLAAGTLAGLSPEAVLVPSGSQTPFDPSTEEPDPGDEEPYTPPNNNGSVFFDVVKALAATFGLSMLLEADPVGNVINAAQTFLDNVVQTFTQAFSTMLKALIQPVVSAFSVMIQGLFTLDIPATQLKIEGIRSAIFARIPCVEETLNAWYDIMAVNGSNLISSFTFFGETFSISSGTLLQAFQGFGSMIKQAFRFVFWFIFLKGMRRRVTSFLGLVSAER